MGKSNKNRSKKPSGANKKPDSGNAHLKQIPARYFDNEIDALVQLLASSLPSDNEYKKIIFAKLSDIFKNYEFLHPFQGQKNEIHQIPFFYLLNNPLLPVNFKGEVLAFAEYYIENNLGRINHSVSIQPSLLKDDLLTLVRSYLRDDFALHIECYYQAIFLLKNISKEEIISLLTIENLQELIVLSNSFLNQEAMQDFMQALISKNSLIAQNFLNEQYHAAQYSPLKKDIIKALGPNRFVFDLNKADSNEFYYYIIKILDEKISDLNLVESKTHEQTTLYKEILFYFDAIFPGYLRKNHEQHAAPNNLFLNFLLSELDKSPNSNADSKLVRALNVALTSFGLVMKYSGDKELKFADYIDKVIFAKQLEDKDLFPLQSIFISANEEVMKRFAIDVFFPIFVKLTAQQQEELYKFSPVFRKYIPKSYQIDFALPPEFIPEKILELFKDGKVQVESELYNYFTPEKIAELRQNKFFTEYAYFNFLINILAAENLAYSQEIAIFINQFANIDISDSLASKFAAIEDITMDHNFINRLNYVKISNSEYFLNMLRINEIGFAKINNHLFKKNEELDNLVPSIIKRNSGICEADYMLFSIFTKFGHDKLALDVFSEKITSFVDCDLKSNRVFKALELFLPHRAKEVIWQQAGSDITEQDFKSFFALYRVYKDKILSLIGHYHRLVYDTNYQINLTEYKIDILVSVYEKGRQDLLENHSSFNAYLLQCFLVNDRIFALPEFKREFFTESNILYYDLGLLKAVSLRAINSNRLDKVKPFLSFFNKSLNANDQAESYVTLLVCYNILHDFENLSKAHIYANPSLREIIFLLDDHFNSLASQKVTGQTNELIAKVRNIQNLFYDEIFDESCHNFYKNIYDSKQLLSFSNLVNIALLNAKQMEGLGCQSKAIRKELQKFLVQNFKEHNLSLNKLYNASPDNKSLLTLTLHILEKSKYLVDFLTIYKLCFFDENSLAETSLNELKKVVITNYGGDLADKIIALYGLNMAEIVQDDNLIEDLIQQNFLVSNLTKLKVIFSLLRDLNPEYLANILDQEFLYCREDEKLAMLILEYLEDYSVFIARIDAIEEIDLILKLTDPKFLAYETNAANKSISLNEVKTRKIIDTIFPKNFVKGPFLPLLNVILKNEKNIAYLDAFERIYNSTKNSLTFAQYISANILSYEEISSDIFYNFVIRVNTGFSQKYKDDIIMPIVNKLDDRRKLVLYNNYPHFRDNLQNIADKYAAENMSFLSYHDFAEILNLSEVDLNLKYDFTAVRYLWTFNDEYLLQRNKEEFPSYLHALVSFVRQQDAEKQREYQDKVLYIFQRFYDLYSEIFPQDQGFLERKYTKQDMQKIYFAQNLALLPDSNLYYRFLNISPDSDISQQMSQLFLMVRDFVDENSRLGYSSYFINEFEKILFNLKKITELSHYFSHSYPSKIFSNPLINESGNQQVCINFYESTKKVLSFINDICYAELADETGNKQVVALKRYMILESELLQYFNDTQYNQNFYNDSEQTGYYKQHDFSVPQISVAGNFEMIFLIMNFARTKFLTSFIYAIENDKSLVEEVIKTIVAAIKSSKISPSLLEFFWDVHLHERNYNAISLIISELSQLDLNYMSKSNLHDFIHLNNGFLRSINLNLVTFLNLENYEEMSKFLRNFSKYNGQLSSRIESLSIDRSLLSFFESEKTNFDMMKEKCLNNFSKGKKISTSLKLELPVNINKIEFQKVINLLVQHRIERSELAIASVNAPSIMALIPEKFNFLQPFADDKDFTPFSFLMQLPLLEEQRFIILSFIIKNNLNIYENAITELQKSPMFTREEKKAYFQNLLEQRLATDFASNLQKLAEYGIEVNNYLVSKINLSISSILPKFSLEFVPKMNNKKENDPLANLLAKIRFLSSNKGDEEKIKKFFVDLTNLLHAADNQEENQALVINALNESYFLILGSASDALQAEIIPSFFAIYALLEEQLQSKTLEKELQDKWQNLTILHNVIGKKLLKQQFSKCENNFTKFSFRDLLETLSLELLKQEGDISAKFTEALSSLRPFNLFHPFSDEVKETPFVYLFRMPMFQQNRQIILSSLFSDYLTSLDKDIAENSVYAFKQIIEQNLLSLAKLGVELSSQDLVFINEIVREKFPNFRLSIVSKNSSSTEIKAQDNYAPIRNLDSENLDQELLKRFLDYIKNIPNISKENEQKMAQEILFDSSSFIMNLQQYLPSLESVNILADTLNSLFQQNKRNVNQGEEMVELPIVFYLFASTQNNLEVLSSSFGTKQRNQNICKSYEINDPGGAQVAHVESLQEVKDNPRSRKPDLANSIL